MTAPERVCAHQECTEAVEGHPSKRYCTPSCRMAEGRRKEQDKRHARPPAAPALPVVAVERKPWRPEGWPAEPRWAS